MHINIFFDSMHFMTEIIHPYFEYENQQIPWENQSKTGKIQLMADALKTLEKTQKAVSILPFHYSPPTTFVKSSYLKEAEEKFDKINTKTKNFLDRFSKTPFVHMDIGWRWISTLELSQEQDFEADIETVFFLSGTPLNVFRTIQSETQDPSNFEAFQILAGHLKKDILINTYREEKGHYVPLGGIIKSDPSYTASRIHRIKVGLFQITERI